ncbi:MAG: ATP-grasp domain-containing protein [Azoarcus sp.]|jgi:carbamoylphosphate synthase large subunit|nr:ATP-grasp domain-containing protein [Azoarcus sp.]
MRIWFNRAFSSIHAALRLIRENDTDGRYELVASHPNPHALVRLNAHHFFEEPDNLKGTGYLEWCERFCREQRIDIFVPGKEATALAAEHQRFAQAGTSILSCADQETLELIHDKHRFSEKVRCESAPPPAGKVCSDLASFDVAYEKLAREHHVLCIKPAISVYGIGFRKICEDRSAFSIFAAGDVYQIDLTSLRNMLGAQETFAPLLVMEYLDGDEFSVDCIADRGVLKCAIARRKPSRSSGGQIIDSREDIQRACRQIIAQFELNGFMNIQFREGCDGLRLLEVNPRMSGGIAMACLAGPNLPYLGLAGFDQGYGALTIPPISAGLRVGEFNQATVLQ